MVLLCAFIAGCPEGNGLLSCLAVSSIKHVCLTNLQLNLATVLSGLIILWCRCKQTFRYKVDGRV